METPSMIEKRERETLEKAKEVLEEARKEGIKQEKLLAQNILLRIMTIDPEALVAGGAPRDWEQGRECRDIDIFLRSNADAPWHAKPQIEKAMTVDFTGEYDEKRMLGWHDDDRIADLDENILRPLHLLDELKDITCEEQYDNSNVRAIFEVEIAMESNSLDIDEIVKKVQFIVVKEVDTRKLFQTFDCSINQIALKVDEYPGASAERFWFRIPSTLYQLTQETNIIKFSEEEFKKGEQEENEYPKVNQLDHNKAYNRFVKDGDYTVGNELQMAAYLANNHIRGTHDKIFSDFPENRHIGDLPF